jgi:pilus assembly protein CpaC
MSRLALLIALSLPVAAFQVKPAEEKTKPAGRELEVTVGKSLVVDSPVTIQRVSVANARVAEALAVTPREVLVNGKAVGETSLIIWQQGGQRLMFDLNVRPNTSKLEAIRRLIREEIKKKDP